MTVDLFGTEHEITLRNKGMQWKYHILQGTIDGRDAGMDTVSFAFGQGGVTHGVIEFDDQQFELAYTGLGQVHGLHQFDPYAQSSQDSCNTTPATVIQLEPQTSANAGDEFVANPPDGVVTVDLGVWYTPAARSAAGGSTSLESAIANRTSIANTGTLQSMTAAGLLGTSHQWRIVFTGEVLGYVETGNSSTELNRFRNNGDGFMDEVHVQRSTWGADMCHLITNNTGGGIYGQAFTIPCNASNVNQNRPNMFCLTDRGCFGGRTFMHEMGHLMGCAHDRAGGLVCGGGTAYGAQTANGQQRSIMARNSLGGTRVNFWSGGSIAPNGQQLGNAQNDNTAEVRLNTPFISTYLPTVVGANPPTLSGISSSSQQAYNLIPVQVTLTGTDLNSAAQINVGPSQANIVSQSATTLVFTLPNGYPIGSHQVTALNGAGTSNALSYSVNATNPAVLVGPTIHTTGTTQNYTNWGGSSTDNCVFHMFISASNTPSALPGVVTMGIGNGFTSFFLLAAIPTDTGGQANLPFNIPVGGVPPLSTLFYQSIQICDSTTLPWDDDLTNVINVLYF